VSVTASFKKKQTKTKQEVVGSSLNQPKTALSPASQNISGFIFK
jgi:hypothetical protein